MRKNTAGDLLITSVGVIPALRPNRGFPPVAGVHPGLIRQYQHSFMDALYQLAAAAPGHERRPYASAENGVSGKYHVIAQQAYAPGCVSWCMYDGETYPAGVYLVAFAQQPVRRVRRFILDAELGTVSAVAFHEIGVFDVYCYLCPCFFLDIAQGGDVVGMAVGQHDDLNIQPGIIYRPDNIPLVAPGVDDHAGARGCHADDIAIG